MSGPALGEVRLDGTMGTAGEISGPNYEIQTGYGQTAGSNLFHSFSHFNINTNEVADFKVPESIQRIISRVTGGSASQIDGTLRSSLTRSAGISNADLYLINPGGVVFGENAALDLGGSFHVTTADYLKMGSDERFYARLNNSILSTAAPTAFGFLSHDVKGITFKGRGLVDSKVDTGLKVLPGKTISVTGGNIEINGSYYFDAGAGRNTALGNFTAAGGRMNLAGVASAGEVVPTETGLDVSSFQSLGDVTLNDYGQVSVSSEGSGQIFIRGGNLYLKQYSSLEADTTGGKDGGRIDIEVQKLSLTKSNIFSDTKGVGDGGDITIKADQSVEMDDFSLIFANATGTGSTETSGGKILLESKALLMTTGSKLSSETYGQSKGGRIRVQGAEQVNLKEESEIFAGTEGNGNAGAIEIETKTLLLEGKSKISSDTNKNKGQGGDVTITGPGGDFADSIDVTDSSSLFAGAIDGEFAEAGDGGNVHLKAKAIVFKEGGKIGSESTGGGRGGNVTLEALGSISIYGSDAAGNESKVYTTAKEEAAYAGDAGNITISAGQILFGQKGGIDASTLGPAKAGVIKIQTNQLRLDQGASISSASESSGAGGDAGSITIGPQVPGNGKILLDNVSLINTATKGEGNAGSINLDAFQIFLDNRSTISSASLSPGNAGDAGTITANAVDSVTLDNNSALTTEAINGGDGRIIVRAQRQVLLNGSKITTSVKRGKDDAGDITIDPKFVILKSSQVIANAFEGRGGNILIVANHFIQSSDSVVDASSELGIDGSVEIDAPDVDISSELAVLPSSVLDATKWARTPCAARTGQNVSRLVYRGRYGIPTAPDDWLASPPLSILGANNNKKVSNISLLPAMLGKLVSDAGSVQPCDCDKEDDK